MICDVLIIDSYAYPINDELYMYTCLLHQDQIHPSINIMCHIYIYIYIYDHFIILIFKCIFMFYMFLVNYLNLLIYNQLRVLFC